MAKSASRRALIPSQSSTHSSIAPVVVPITLLLILALITYGLRLYTRLRPYPNLKWDDHTMTIAVAFTVANWAVQVALMVSTKGQSTQTMSFSTIEYILKLSFITKLLWVWSVTTIKV